MTNRFPLKIIRLIVIAGLILLAARVGRAQGEAPVVHVHAATETDAVHAGSQVKVAVIADVAPGYHINAHKPTLDYMIPTRFEINSTEQFSLKDVVYPKGEPKKFPFSDIPLSVYEGKVVVAAVLLVGKNVPVGTYPLKAKFAYQACSEHACLPPTSVPLALTLRVVPQAAPLKVVEPNVFERTKFQ